MKKNFTVLCSMLIALSMFVAVFGVDTNMQTDVTTATAKVFYAENEESTTSASGLSDLLGGLSGGSDSSGKAEDIIGQVSDYSGSISGILDGIGSGSSGDSDSSLGNFGQGFGDIAGGLGGLLGGLGDSIGDSVSDKITTTQAATRPAATTSPDVGLIIPVPAATDGETTQAQSSTVAEDTTVVESYNFEDNTNPYQKPTKTFVAGDADESIKWLQWIFVYTQYGLDESGITGVLDEDTVAVVKKLQKEKGLLVDGNITEDVIKATEVIYYQKVLGEDNSAIEVSFEMTSGQSNANQTTDKQNEEKVPVALLVIVLVIIWLAAIGAIVLLFVFKKKKSKAVKTEEKADVVKSQESKDDNTEIKSMADLFEEADKK